VPWPPSLQIVVVVLRRRIFAVGASGNSKGILHCITGIDMSVSIASVIFLQKPYMNIIH